MCYVAMEGDSISVIIQHETSTSYIFIGLCTKCSQQHPLSAASDLMPDHLKLVRKRLRNALCKKAGPQKMLNMFTLHYQKIPTTSNPGRDKVAVATTSPPPLPPTVLSVHFPKIMNKQKVIKCVVHMLYQPILCMSTINRLPMASCCVILMQAN